LLTERNIDLQEVNCVEQKTREKKENLQREK